MRQASQAAAAQINFQSRKIPQRLYVVFIILIGGGRWQMGRSDFIRAKQAISACIWKVERLGK
jgi:hypothetical protein